MNSPTVVVRAAVAATHPATAKIARLRLAHLCQFLSTPCGWAADGPPDLAGLLTESTIAAYGLPRERPLAQERDHLLWPEHLRQ